MNAGFPHFHSPYYECYARQGWVRAVEMTGGGQFGDSVKARCPQPDHRLWKTRSGTK